MKFSDSHCHIYIDAFDADLDASLQRAQSNHVHRFFLPNIDSNYTERVLKLSQSENNMYPMMGLHPCSVNEGIEEELEKIKTSLYSSPETFVGVGEIGLDLYWEKAFLSQQIYAFKEQVKWALDLDKPIIIHVRDAFDELFEVMDEINTDGLTGIFHCFTGNQAQAQKALSYSDFYIGLGGVLTFKNSGLDKVAVNIPMDRIVLETDSPYLAPHPFRGKRNEPSYLLYVAEKLAKVKGISLEQVSDITENNIDRVFKL